MRRFVAAPLLALALVATAQLPVSASGSRVFVIDGRGWGHGHGMGQYGARALGEAGATWRAILKHYYTGIAFSKRSTRIRVQIDRTGAVAVSGDTRLTLRWASGRIAAVSPHASSSYRVLQRRGRFALEVGRTPRGLWRTVSSGVSPRITVSGARTVGLTGSSTRWYPGTITLTQSGSSQIAVIDTLPLEQYVQEVVPREMPAVWSFAALQAQAVAVRTYAVREMHTARARHRTYDICGSAMCQVFGGYAISTSRGLRVLEHHRSSAATRSTSGIVMTWRAQPILAQYSSSTGGYTASGGLPYLKPVPDPGDKSAPMHSWTEVVTAAQIHAVWPALGSVRGIRVGARDGHGDLGGRAERLVLVGTRGSIPVSTQAFAGVFGLPSSWFAVRARMAGHVFTFDMGYGTRNAEVPYLQRRLRAEGVYPKGAPITTYYGPITRASVERYQRAHHISATGYLGPITRASLNASA
ncbi:MAG: SpoIID/LytB domain-containing protein [Actinomycetota bacterium]